VRIEHFTLGRIPDPDGNASPWDFHLARNAVVRACKLHGPTGPFGILPLEKSKGTDNLYSLWERGDPDMVYFVCDDQYNEERYQYLECIDLKFFTEAWIVDLMAALKEFPAWGIGINSIPGSYAIVFANKIMVKGIPLDNAHDLPSFISGVHEAFRNKDKYEKRRRSGDCRSYSFENDLLICDVEFSNDEGSEELRLARDNVEKAWLHPFTGVGMLTLKDETMVELPDDSAFKKICEWIGAQV
jgi:hypothetical protein